MKKPDDSHGPHRFDVEAIRAQFPILNRRVHGKPLVYFDNAATTQKPQVVIDTIRHYYEHANANIHRGVHTLSQQATEAYEQARQKIAKFINVADARQIIFTRGTTEGINLVAACYGRKFLKADDEIILTAMEHHSNIVPWQLIAEEVGAKIRVIPMNDRGELLMDEYENLLSDRTKIVSVVHLSNSLGTINPVREIIAKAHKRGAIVLVDGAQWVAHAPTDVRQLDVDFYAFSGHKLYGPTGIGVLYGKAELLEKMSPYQGGGDMISSVTFEKTTYAELPHKFEAGTPHIAGGIGLGAAIDFVTAVGMRNIARHEEELLEHATKRLSAIRGLRLIGTADDKGGVLSFVIDDPPMGSLDIGMRLDAAGIAVRTGHHCCQPVMDRLEIGSTARASLAMYNTKQEVDFLADTLERMISAGTSQPAQAAPAPVAMPGLEFPPPAAPTPKAAAAELIEDFDLLDAWEDRYQYLIELGAKLAPMPDALKTSATRVHGCMSLVHLYARHGSGDTLQFLASSDADIVRGLLAVLQRIFNGQSAAAILQFDIDGFLKRLGLNQNLIMGRRIGLDSMIRRIREEASKLAA